MAADRILYDDTLMTGGILSIHFALGISESMNGTKRRIHDSLILGVCPIHEPVSTKHMLFSTTNP